MDNLSIFNIQDNSGLSEEDVGNILNFLYDVRETDPIESRYHHILSCLNKYFGCVCSSLWSVRSDFSLTDPYSVGFDPALLEDYEKYLHVFDDYYVQNLDLSIVNGKDVFEVDDENRVNRDSLYLQELSNMQVTQKYGIMIREGGKVIAAIALFRPTESDKNPPILSPRCLEILSPFITQELLNERRAHSDDRINSILNTILNTCETGIALFNVNNPGNIIYFNPVCVKYCFDIKRNPCSKSIISDFLEDLMSPGEKNLLKYTDSSPFSITAHSGTCYRVRLVNNRNGMMTLYILPQYTPSDVRAPAEEVQSFFSTLTSREREIALLISQGMTNSQIANRMYISISTVKSHIQHIFEKADVSNRTSLIALMSDKRQNFN